MANRSDARALEWADPEIRQRRIDGIRRAALRRYEDDHERRLASERTKKFYADPENKAAHAKAMAAMGERTRGREGSAGGMHRTSEYKIWQAMIARCTNPRQRGFKDYGGRGIRVCSEWRGRGGFVRFFASVGPRPTAKHSLGRIDNDGDYCPGNVQWETWTQQMANTRRTRQITIDGMTLCVAEWARRLGMTAPGLVRRVKDWPKERWTEELRK